jgi:hypothetical protein
MATNTKKSNLTYPTVLFFLLGALLIGSCSSEPHPGKDVVCIKVKDTASIDSHFIPVMSIDIYKKDFDAERENLKIKCPRLLIPDSETFPKESILEFLKDTTVVALKFYYGIKPDIKSGNKADSTSLRKKKALRLMIVGVNAAGNNVYIKKKGSGLAAQAGGDTEDGGVEYGQCTPPCTLDEP